MNRKLCPVAAFKLKLDADWAPQLASQAGQAATAVWVDGQVARLAYPLPCTREGVLQGGAVQHAVQRELHNTQKKRLLIKRLKTKRSETKNHKPNYLL